MKSTEKTRKKCVTLAKKIAVLRDNKTCRKCLRNKFSGWAQHGSHVYPEGRYKSMSADVDNIIDLCYYCHFQWWHKNPLEAAEWFNTNFPELAETLKIRARIIRQVNWDAKLIELKEHAEAIRES